MHTFRIQTSIGGTAKWGGSGMTGAKRGDSILLGVHCKKKKKKKSILSFEDYHPT